MIIKTWKLKPKIPLGEEDKIRIILSQNPHLVFGHPLPEGEGNMALLAQLLYNRGLTDQSQITEFLNPEYEKLDSPFLFKDMQKAVDRIWQAIEQNEKITIYGDYDADAITANAVLRQVFNYLEFQNIDSYIPDRFTEGYGVNLDALLKIKDQGSKVIITVDCGTNSVDAADFCKKSGIDFIITDHHEIIGDLPKAFAIINPKNSSENYPDLNITGVGVAFKLACGILSHSLNHNSPQPPLNLRGGEIKPGWEKWLLDLVAIGTVADCHELTGENRILVKFGLKVLPKTKWIGLRALIDSSGLNFSTKLPDTYTLGFVLAPRLNAAGRLEHANAALELLLETNSAEAQKKALGLESINRSRQEITQRILSEAREEALLVRERKVIVMMNQQWHKGVVGLVAGKLAEEFFKPTFVLSLENGEATGSARTVGNFNVVEALQYSSNHLIRFGGHKQAAGLTLRSENFQLLYRSLLDYADQNSDENSFSPVLELEGELLDADLEFSTLNLISQLEPFGTGNPRPKFLIKGAAIVSQKAVGTGVKHLQLRFKIGSKIIQAIAFNFRPLEKLENLDIACELIEDGWNGKKQLKLKIIDIKLN